MPISYFELWTIVVQVTGIIVLIVYTFQTWRQVEALIESNRTNKQALILGRRAWINIRISGNYHGVNVEVLNVGMVPALMVLFGHKLVVAKPADLKEFQPITNSLPIGSLGVQDSYPFIPRTDEALGKYNNPDGGVNTEGNALQVLCQVIYDNGFGQECHVECSWYYLAGSWTRTFYQAT